MPKIPFPYHLCSAEQCRKLDERTINDFGIDGFTLMEIAGTKAADFIESNIKDKSRGLFLCGKGNNAGDALVIARILSEKYHTTDICFVMGDSDLSTDTQKNLSLLKKLKGDINFVNIDSLSNLQSYDFIVDGILGTGLNSEVREPIHSIINSVNSTQTPLFSLDVPTGLHADSGKILGNAVKANFTITFGALKPGFYLNDGINYSGEIVLCELPFPNHYRENTAYLLDENWVSSNNDAIRNHKYDGGVLYIIAGSEGLTGAAVLAAKSAWNTGIGAVILITPKGLLPIYEKNLIQIIKKPVGSNSCTQFSKQHLPEIEQLISEKPGIVLIGPGLGRSDVTIEFAQHFLGNFKGNCVIDADALFALSLKKIDKPEHASWILTPHPGELTTLLDDEVSDDFERFKQTSTFSKSINSTVVSKGYPTIVTDSKGNAFFTSYDTRIFSRAGFGDVLAGNIAANYLLLKNSNLACFTALLHGKHKADQFLATKPQIEPLDLI